MARILVVDDEHSIRDTLGAFLESAGHDVALAADAFQASSELSAHDFDVVVCDIVLLGRDGLEFLEEARNASRDLQVILIAGQPGVTTASEAVRQRAFDYIPKPVSREKIVSIVNAAADRKALLDRNRELEEENRRHRENLEWLVQERAAKLRISEKRYRELFRGIADPVFVFDQETRRFLDANGAALNRYGYTIAELREMVPEDLHPPNQSQTVADSIQNASDTSLNEYTHRTKSGESFPVEIHTEEMDYDGRRAWISIARDITQRKQAEENLQQYESIVNSSQDLMTLIDSDYRYLSVSDSFCVCLGKKREDVLGRTVAEIWGRKPFEDSIRAHLDKCFAGGTSEFSGWFDVPLRGRRYYDVRYTPYVSDGGSIHCAVVVSRDITTRKGVELALQESEERLQSLFNSMSEGVALHEFVFDSKGEPMDYRIVEVNPAFESVLGIDRSDAVGAFASDLYGSGDAPFLQTYARVAASGKPVTFERFFPPLDKHFLISVFRPSKGRFATVFSDVTAHRRSEEILRRSLEATIQAVAWIIEKRDPYTAGHQRRVMQLAEEIARAMGLATSQIEGIRAAAILHDIGKITVPADILSKPSTLTEIEYGLLQDHPKVAYDVLQTIEFPWPVAEIVYQHHERMDGSGYPRGLSGDDILLEARIIAVADVVEAISSHRPYRPALGLEGALDEIETHRARLYDDDVVNTCLRLFKDGAFEFDGEGTQPSASSA